MPPSDAPRHFQVRGDSIGDNSSEDKWQWLSCYKGAVFFISGKSYLIKVPPEKGQKEDEVIIRNFGKRHVLTFESQVEAADFLTEAAKRYSNKRAATNRQARPA